MAPTSYTGGYLELATNWEILETVCRTLAWRRADAFTKTTLRRSSRHYLRHIHLSPRYCPDQTLNPVRVLRRSQGGKERKTSRNVGYFDDDV